MSGACPDAERIELEKLLQLVANDLNGWAKLAESLNRAKRRALMGRLTIAHKHRIDRVTGFEPTVNKNVVGSEVDTIRQQVFECVGANCATFLDGVDQRRRAHQLRLNRRDTDGFQETYQPERRMPPSRASPCPDRRGPRPEGFAARRPRLAR
jgi:hypothetical protein